MATSIEQTPTRETEVGAIHVHQFMTLDGVIDEPTWSAAFDFLPEMEKSLGAVTDRCSGILLGRRTYEMFEPAWSTRTVEDDPGAPFFNDTMKYVVTSTRTTATWRNSKIIGPYDPDTIRTLKEGVGDVFVSGSGTLVRALLADGLVDHLHLFLYPLTRGSGPRLFAEGAAPLDMELTTCEPYEHGMVYLAYRPQPKDDVREGSGD